MHHRVPGASSGSTVTFGDWPTETAEAASATTSPSRTHRRDPSASTLVTSNPWCHHRGPCGPAILTSGGCCAVKGRRVPWRARGQRLFGRVRCWTSSIRSRCSGQEDVACWTGTPGVDVSTDGALGPAPLGGIARSTRLTPWRVGLASAADLPRRRPVTRAVMRAANPSSTREPAPVPLSGRRSSDEPPTSEPPGHRKNRVRTRHTRRGPSTVRASEETSTASSKHPAAPAPPKKGGTFASSRSEHASLAPGRPFWGPAPTTPTRGTPAHPGPRRTPGASEAVRADELDPRRRRRAPCSCRKRERLPERGARSARPIREDPAHRTKIEWRNPRTRSDPKVSLRPRGCTRRRWRSSRVICTGTGLPTDGKARKMGMKPEVSVPRRSSAPTSRYRRFLPFATFSLVTLSGRCHAVRGSPCDRSPEPLRARAPSRAPTVNRPRFTCDPDAERLCSGHPEVRTRGTVTRPVSPPAMPPNPVSLLRPGRPASQAPLAVQGSG